jgi:hypothetical protein
MKSQEFKLSILSYFSKRVSYEISRIQIINYDFHHSFFSNRVSYEASTIKTLHI